MRIEPDEILDIVDEVTIALGEILLRHRQLREGLLDGGNAIAASQDRIEKRRAEIEKEREKIRKTREVIRRRRELEKISKEHEKEVAESRSTATASPILDGKGVVIGWIQRAGGNRVTVLNAKGRVIARIADRFLS